METLTPRQRQVCDLAIQGLSHKQIARHLGITHRTVEGHIYHAYRVYGVNNKVGLLFKIMGASNGSN
ncbi:MAG TPA: helix-turn-helix transcriptional regulator [Terriglobales bacterium]